MQTRMIEGDAITIATQVHGDRSDSPIVLVMGQWHLWRAQDATLSDTITAIRGALDDLSAGSGALRYERYGERQHVRHERQSRRYSEVYAARCARALLERDLERSPSFASATNHFLIPDDNGTRTLAAFDIKVPTLVIHGKTVPTFPIEHGEA